MPAPVASGWSGRRVGLAPTGKRRLLTAHVASRAFPICLDLGVFAAKRTFTPLGGEEPPQTHANNFNIAFQFERLDQSGIGLMALRFESRRRPYCCRGGSGGCLVFLMNASHHGNRRAGEAEIGAVCENRRQRRRP